MRKTLASIALWALGCVASLPGIVAAQTNSTVSVRLVDTLSTRSSQPGDTFSATLAAPLIWRDHVVAEKGAPVTGHVTQVLNSGRLRRPALITLSLRTAQAHSGVVPIQTGDLTIKADSHAKRNLLIIGGTAAAGAAIGAAAGGGKGATIGAAAGAGAGTIGAYLTGDQEVVLPTETLLTFHVASVTVSSQELARLQPVAAPGDQGYESNESYPVVVYRHRHHHHGDEDEDEEGEGEHEHEHEHEGHHYRARYPKRIDVLFISSDHRAKLAIFWPERTEYLFLRGDDLDDILEPLSERIHVSVDVIRPRIIVQRDED